MDIPLLLILAIAPYTFTSDPVNRPLTHSATPDIVPLLILAIAHLHIPSLLILAIAHLHIPSLLILAIAPLHIPSLLILAIAPYTFCYS